MNKRIGKTFGILFLLLELAVVPKAMQLMLSQPLASLSPLEIVVLSMTFGSIALCIIMSYASMSEHESYPQHTFLFELMVFLCCIAPMTDLITKAIDAEGMPGLNLLVNTIFYLIGINIAYTIMLYEFLILDAGHHPVLKKVKRIAAVLVILDNLATLLNIPLGFFFTITEDGRYQSADSFWIAYLVPAIIIAITAVTAFLEMKPGRQKRAFMFFWVFAILSSMLQIWNAALSVQYTGYTLTLVVIYINIQSELDSSCIKLQSAEDC